MPPTTYRSKIGAWLVLLFAFAIGAALWSVWQAAMHPDAASVFAALLVLVLGCGLPLWMLLATRYTLTDTTLHVRCGPMRSDVPLAEIGSVTPTRNPLAGPALSLDRLAITYANGRGLILISPRDKAAFVRDLEARRQAISRSASA